VKEIARFDGTSQCRTLALAGPETEMGGSEPCGSYRRRLIARQNRTHGDVASDLMEQLLHRSCFFEYMAENRTVVAQATRRQPRLVSSKPRIGPHNTGHARIPRFISLPATSSVAPFWLTALRPASATKYRIPAHQFHCTIAEFERFGEASLAQRSGKSYSVSTAMKRR
jgi:hypothetical protein